MFPLYFRITPRFVTGTDVDSKTKELTLRHTFERILSLIGVCRETVDDIFDGFLQHLILISLSLFISSS